MKKLVLLFVLLLAVPAESRAGAGSGVFEPFVFHVTGSCRDTRNLWFHQSAPWFRMDLGRSPSGRVVYADLTLQIYANGSYWGQYSEVEILRYLPNGGTEGRQIFGKRIQGSWHLENSRRLVIPGLLTAAPARIVDHGGEAQGMGIQFTAPIHDPRLTRRSWAFGAIYSKFGPRGMNVGQYCAKP